MSVFKNIFRDANETITWARSTCCHPRTAR